MDYELKQVSIGLIITICIVTILLSIVKINESYTKRVITAMEKGYCESTTVGYNGTVWQKFKEEK